VTPDASPVERAAPAQAGAQFAQGLLDAGTDAAPARSPEIQAWIDAEVARCIAAGQRQLKSIRPCKDGPASATVEDTQACGMACFEAVYPMPFGTPTPSERAVYQEGLEACLAGVDQSLGRGEIRCYFNGPIRGGTSMGDPYQQCEARCRNHAAEVRTQWAPR
jgi:hypothetical protein